MTSAKLVLAARLVLAPKLVSAAKLLLANRYFSKMVSKCYVDRVSSLGIQTFQQYLDYRYRDCCYYYSGYAIMGMTDNDKVVRGLIDLYDWKGYAHGWVEFWYKGEEYVFDSMVRRIVTKEEYYSYFNPRVEHQFTKKEVLSMYLTQERASVSQNGKMWVINKWIDNPEKGFLSTFMSGARIELSTNGKVKKFVGYSEPGD